MLKNRTLPAFTPRSEFTIKAGITDFFFIELEMRNILRLKMAVLYAPLLVGIGLKLISLDFPMGNDTAETLRFGSWLH